MIKENLSENEARIGLTQIYRKVLICDHCNKKYGSDSKDETPINLCPMCNKISIVKRITENAIKD